MTTAAILDVDGTLVDTNYHHTLAWLRAFARHDVEVPAWRVHRHIGMGGDQFVAAVAGDDVEERLGDAIRETEGDLYGEMIGEVRPLDGARELILALRERVDRVVLASSAKAEEVDHYVELLDAGDLAHGWTTSADVEATKPEPDLVCAALEKAEASEAIMFGDTTWDCEAAARAGVPVAGVLTGGFGEAELLAAGAVAVFASLAELRDGLDGLPVAGSRAA